MTKNSLDLRFSKSVLLKLLNEKEVLKTSLQEIVSNLYSLGGLLEELKKDGLINIQTMKYGKNIQKISLTAKGIAVARELKKADDIASGRSIPKESVSVELPQGVHEQVIKILKINRVEKSEEEFVLDAVKDKIRKWKRDREELEGHP